MSKLSSGFKWIDPKEFDLNKYTSNSSKGCVLEVDREYPKLLHELHNDCPLTSDKIEIINKMQSEYQLMIADLYNIPIGNIKKLLPKHFDQEMYVLHYESLKLYFILQLKLKKLNCILEFNQSQQLNPYNKFKAKQKEQKQKKMKTKMEKRCTSQ